MANTSITTLLQLIADADTNLEGLVKWAGENNLETIENLSVGEIQNRGILVYDDTGALGASGYAETQLAIVTNTALYKWYPTIVPGTGRINASDGGQWRPVIISGTGSAFATYTTTVDTSGGLTFVVNHNLGKQYPLVQCLTTTIPGLPISIQSITYTDTNNMTVVFQSGDANKTIRIIAQ